MTVCLRSAERNEQMASLAPHPALLLVYSSHLPKRLKSHDESEFYRCTRCQSVMTRKRCLAAVGATWQFVIGDPQKEQWS